MSPQAWPDYLTPAPSQQPAYRPPPSPVASLDGYTRNSPLNPTWESVEAANSYYRRRKRRGRGYHRAMSGLRLPGQYRLLTLTTSVEAERAGKSIVASWGALVQRLRRRRLVAGYFRVKEFTKAGRPHLHVILRGGWVAQWVVSRWWNEIHLSPVVDIRYVRGARPSAGYVVKYLGKDVDARYSCSWDWVWRGFVQDWKRKVAAGLRRGEEFGSIIRRWELMLDMYGEYLVRSGEGSGGGLL